MAPRRSETEHNKLELIVEGKLENLTTIGDFITRALNQLGIEKELFQVQVAVDEACTNIIQHAYSGGSDKPIEIYCSMSNKSLIIEIRDWGESFDPESVPSPDTDSELSERQLGGLGLFLMKQMMDEVNYVFYPRKYNKLIMIKHLPPED